MKLNQFGLMGRNYKNCFSALIKNSIGFVPLYVCVSLMSSPMSYSGGYGGGNGGGGVYCLDSVTKEPSLKLLDIWEWSTENPAHLPGMYGNRFYTSVQFPRNEQRTYQQWISIARQRLQDAGFIDLREFDREIEFLQTTFEASANRLSDSFEMIYPQDVVPPLMAANCSLLPIVNYGNDGRIFYHGERMQILRQNSLHYAGLLLHEALGKIYRSYHQGGDTSVVRELTAKLLSEEPLVSAVDRLIDRHFRSDTGLRYVVPSQATGSIRIAIMIKDQGSQQNTPFPEAVQCRIGNVGLRDSTSGEQISYGNNWRIQWFDNPGDARADHHRLILANISGLNNVIRNGGVTLQVGISCTGPQIASVTVMDSNRSIGYAGNGNYPLPSDLQAALRNGRSNFGMWSQLFYDVYRTGTIGLGLNGQQPDAIHIDLR